MQASTMSAMMSLQTTIEITASINWKNSPNTGYCSGSTEASPTHDPSLFYPRPAIIEMMWTHLLQKRRMRSSWSVELAENSLFAWRFSWYSLSRRRTNRKISTTSGFWTSRRMLPSTDSPWKTTETSCKLKQQRENQRHKIGLILGKH